MIKAKPFLPNQVIFRQDALDYPLGQELYHKFKKAGIDIVNVAARGPFPQDQELSFRQKFIRAKKTIVVAVRSPGKFQPCKPSAHYQLPLVTGCPAHCHYCYLSTNLGKNPYIKVYVNLNELLGRAKKYMEERKPDITIFEGSATSDPVPVERWTGSVGHCIEYFAREKLGRFRFVTKFTDIDSLLELDHNGKTEFRFSLNSRDVIKKFEPATPSLEARIEAAGKAFQAGYPLGFLIAPILLYEHWQDQYRELLELLQKRLASKGKGISFELITHRFTERAKKIIEEIYPRTELPMNQETRQFKYGQFGYGKYVYPAATRTELENYLRKMINAVFPEGEIKYFV